MMEPTLTVAFDDGGTLLRVRRHDDELFNDVDWPLARLEDWGYEGACRLIGNGALMMLQRAHPAVFARHPRITPPPEYFTNTFILVVELIQRSHRSRSRRYVEAIDALLERHAGEMGLASVARTWPYERQQLMQFDN